VRTSVDVTNFLTERGVPHEVFRTRGRLRSAEWLADVLDLRREEVGKVILLEGGDGPVAAIVPAGNEANLSRVRRASRRADLAPVSGERAAELTEFLPEALPPAGLPAGIPLVVDRSLDRDEVLYFAGGEPRSVLKIRGSDLVAATGATVARIAGS
jgi:prolyl-tRNA editing enzyme YbaK/EbsC (Cys-tRNA(Pro) deacylase)